MRILIVNYEYPPLGGGGGIATAALAQELARRHEVTVLTSQGLGLPSRSVENGVSIIRVPTFFRRQAATANVLSMTAFILMGIRVGKKLLKANQFDIINTHFVLPSGPVGDALARFGGVPNILSVHGGDLYDPSKFISPHRHGLLKSWIRRLLRRADRVVGQSGNTLDNLRDYYTSEIDGIRIPLGIERPIVTTPANRQDYGFAEDEILLVTVGRLVARKAVDQLLAVLHTLKNKKVRLLVIGAGPLEQSLREECRDRNIEQQVSFMGYVEESKKFQLLQMSDIFVSTSQHEGFGLVFLEAMHCGLPIVCYDYGGQTDFLGDQVTGRLIPLNDLDQFREGCQQLIENPEFRKSVGNANQELVKEFYIDTCARRYEAVFEPALANSK